MFVFLKFLVNIYFNIFYRVKVTGNEKIPPEGGAILCSNHLGQMDMFFIGFRLQRKIHWMAKEELFRNPLLGAVIKSLGAFPIKRGKADVGSVRKAINLVEEGHIIGIFPEATRTRGKKRSEIRVKPGVAMISASTGVAIIPVAIKGSYKLFGRVRVNIGDPFKLEINPDVKLSSEDLTEKSRNIMDKVYMLLEEK